MAIEGMTTVLFQVTINFAVDSHEFADSAAKIYNEATSDCINTWIENVYLLVMKKISQVCALQANSTHSQLDPKTNKILMCTGYVLKHRLYLVCKHLPSVQTHT